MRRKTELVRVPIEPALKEILRRVAGGRGSNLAAFFRDSAVDRARGVLGVDEDVFWRGVAETAEELDRDG